MLGPVFAADLRGHTRRPRVMILRILFVSVLLCLFIICYGTLPGHLSRKQNAILADFASQFVFLYMLGQFVFLLMIGPTYVAGAIAEERQRGTLDFLFSSNLTDGEIIYGKYFSRLALLLQFVLVGLPVLALVQLIGGVSLELVGGLFLGTLGCLASLTALTLLISVMSKHARQALLRTFLVVVWLALVWVAVWMIVRHAVLYDWFPSSMASTLQNLCGDVLMLNPVFITMLLREMQSVTGNIEGMPLRLFGFSLLMHGVIAAALLITAKTIVRRRFLRQIDLSAKRDKLVREYQKPAVWTLYPLYWKERYVHGGPFRLFTGKSLFRGQQGNTTSLHIVLGVILFFILGFGGFVLSVVPSMGLSAFRISDDLQVLARWLIMGLLVAVHLAIILRTASGIAIEKDRDTWDALIASPVKIQDLLLARVYGGLLSCRWLFLLALALLAFFVVMDDRAVRGYGWHGANFGDVIIFAVANLGYLAFTLGLAAFCSLNSASSIRNVMNATTILVMLNLMPYIAMLFLGTSGTGDSVMAILIFLTNPGSVPVILGLGFFAIACVVTYYRFPKLRWLYSIVFWMGNVLVLNALLLLVISGFSLAFNGNIPFERLVQFFAPLMLDDAVMSQYLLPGTTPFAFAMYIHEGIMLYLVSSAALMAVVGVLLYLVALSRLKRTSGRVEYSRVANRARKRQTTAGVASLPSS